MTGHGEGGVYAFDPELVSRARAGNRRARRTLRRRTRSAAYPLALVVTGGPVAAARALRTAVDAALADDRTSYASAVVTSLHAPTTGGDPADSGRRARAVLALCDGNGLSQATAARLLGLTRSQLATQHALARADVGLPPEPDRCSGWAFVSRPDDGLSAAERLARADHLELCPACAQGLRVRTIAKRSTQVGVLGAAVGTLGVAVDAVLVAGAPTVAATVVGVVAAGGIGAQVVARPPAAPAPPAASVGAAPGSAVPVARPTAPPSTAASVPAITPAGPPAGTLPGPPSPASTAVPVASTVPSPTSVPAPPTTQPVGRSPVPDPAQSTAPGGAPPPSPRAPGLPPLPVLQPPGLLPVLPLPPARPLPVLPLVGSLLPQPVGSLLPLPLPLPLLRLPALPLFEPDGTAVSSGVPRPSQDPASR